MPEPAMDAPSLQQALVDIRPQMLKFARLQLQDGDGAEDAVQEALEAALLGAERFAGRAAFRTWVFTILRNKIVDLLRERGRTTPLSGLGKEDEDLDEALDALFKANAHWHPQSRPRAWGDPEESLQQAQFWQVFETCLELLPANTARVFMMREFLGFDTDEICRNLTLSTSNCHVILHRARAGLRRCLEQGWFAPEARTC